MKFWKIIFVAVLVFLFSPLSSFASTNTYTRTKENPLVPSDVIVDSTNINDILKIPAVACDEKIYDFADLYSTTEEKALYKQIDAYIDSSDIDAVIVTTKDLCGFGISDYTYHFYDYNDFKIDGVIFVIYMGGSEPEIFMGTSGDKTGKVFTLYTDNRIKQTLAYIYPDIKEGRYYAATDNYVKILQGFFNIERDGNYRVGENGAIVRELPWIELVILASALTFIIVIFFSYRIRGNNKLNYQDDLDSRIDNDTLMVRMDGDTYLDTVLSKKK